uniref:U1-type domain-containing protein n=1 Tax=Strigamia maritima TaxID=126957 RepID=T1IU50_STRMM
MASKSASEFNYCKICCTNYTEGKRHVYSKKHKNTGNRIINKFITRISDGLKLLENPLVDDDFRDSGRRFWCYACEIDVNVHQKSETVLLHYAGMVNHLGSLSHLWKLKSFFRLNGLDRTLLPQCYVTQEKLSGFMSASSKQKNQILQPSTSNCQLPPWLQDDAVVIGPTKQDFETHLASKKPKLPENRVGADYDRSTPVSSDWLPEFGRVWTHGRRLQSKQEFNRKWKKKER